MPRLERLVCHLVASHVPDLAQFQSPGPGYHETICEEPLVKYKLGSNALDFPLRVSCVIQIYARHPVIIPAWVILTVCRTRVINLSPSDIPMIKEAIM
jgi:hypothetical protein